MAAAGAIAHDIYTEILGKKKTEKSALRVSKLTAVAVGSVAILLGIRWKVRTWPSWWVWRSP